MIPNPGYRPEEEVLKNRGKPLSDDQEPRGWATFEELAEALRARDIGFLRHTNSSGIRECILINEDGRKTGLLYIVDSHNKDGYAIYTQLLKQNPKYPCVIDSGIDAQEDAAYLEGMLKG